MLRFSKTIPGSMGALIEPELREKRKQSETATRKLPVYEEGDLK
jgi:hypothetical protein